MKKTIPVFALASSGPRRLADDAGKRFDQSIGIAVDSNGRTLYVIKTNGNTIVRLNVSKKP
jgi:hypothetical protein